MAADAKRLRLAWPSSSTIEGGSYRSGGASPSPGSAVAAPAAQAERWALRLRCLVPQPVRRLVGGTGWPSREGSPAVGEGRQCRGVIVFKLLVNLYLAQGL